MEVQNLRFCQECGREILEDYGFCPACGAFYDKRSQGAAPGSANVRTEAVTTPSEEEQKAAQEAYMVYMTDLRERMYVSNMKLTVLMLAIWVSLSAVISVSLLSGVEALIDWVKMSFAMGGSPLYEGALLAASCVLAFVSAVLCSKRKRWTVAFYSCLASTVLTAFLIIFNDRICIYFFLCGLLASLRVKNLRGMFE